MALAETTLSIAVGQGDKVINVASATSFAAGRLVQIDSEVMKVAKNYSSGTEIPVLRGWEGTMQAAHVITSRVVHGDGSDFGNPPAGGSILTPYVKTVKRVSYSATATLTLPQPGEDLFVVCHGSAFTLTVPVPTKDLDGCEITFTGAAGAAYIFEFTGGLGGASTNYETITFNATGAPAFKVVAYNETWRMLLGVAVTGTVTNVTGSLG